MSKYIFEEKYLDHEREFYKRMEAEKDCLMERVSAMNFLLQDAQERYLQYFNPKVVENVNDIQTKILAILNKKQLAMTSKELEYSYIESTEDTLKEINKARYAVQCLFKSGQLQRCKTKGYPIWIYGLPLWFNFGKIDNEHNPFL